MRLQIGGRNREPGMKGRDEEQGKVAQVMVRDDGRDRLWIGDRDRGQGQEEGEWCRNKRRISVREQGTKGDRDGGQVKSM